MELVDAKCPNCGAELKINKDEKTGVCSHCNSSFLIDDAIKNYVTNNSYKIEHATIINSEGDSALYNEIDRYMAFYNLGDYDKLDEVVEGLKNKFPHKGIARITILHYELTCLIQDIGLDAFQKEADDIEARYNDYEPKSYKDEPPLSSFYDKLGNVELKYSENIDNILTAEEKNKYPDLVNKTKNYLDDYIKICSFNDNMNEDFSPYYEKYRKKQQKKEKINKKPVLKYGLFALIAVALVCVIALLATACSYLFYKKEYVNASDINSLNSPEIETVENKQNITEEISGKEITINFVSKCKIQGRVVGKKNFIGFDIETKVFPSSLFLTWGYLSTKENSNKISWSCSQNGKITYSWDWSLGTSDMICQNSSSCKLVPSDKKVKKEIKNIKKGDAVQIEGYLVNVYIHNNSTITRYYTGTSISDNEIQIIYVTNVVWLR